MNAPKIFGLTGPQLKVLRYITGYREAHGRSPTLLEIAKARGCSAKSNSRRVVRVLIERGHLRPADNRSFEPTHDIAIPRTPDGAPLYAVPLAPRKAIR